MTDNRRKFLGLGVGAMLPAIGFSLTWFCCLPIAAGILGVGLAGMGTRLMSLRPIFTSLSLICLGIAFHQAYRPLPCGEGSCSTATNRRGRRRFVWLMAAMIAMMFTIQYWSSWLIYWIS